MLQYCWRRRRRRRERNERRRRRRRRRRNEEEEEEEEEKGKAKKEAPQQAVENDKAEEQDSDSGATAKPEKAAPAKADVQPAASAAPAVAEGTPEVPKGWWASRSDIGKYTVLGGSGAAVAGLGLLGLSAMQANGAVDRRTELQGMPNWDDQEREKF